MKRLYYLRHGQSEMNVRGLFAGTTDTPLTEEGRVGAGKAGKNIGDIKIDIIIASPLARTLETAELFASSAGLPGNIIRTNKLLVERNFGVLESTTWTPEISFSLLNDNLPDGVEPWDDLVKRAQQLLEYVSQLEHDDILLVGHGGIGRALRSIVKPEEDVHVLIPNSKLVRWI